MPWSHMQQQISRVCCSHARGKRNKELEQQLAAVEQQVGELKKTKSAAGGSSGFQNNHVFDGQTYNNCCVVSGLALSNCTHKLQIASAMMQRHKQSSNRRHWRQSWLHSRPL